MKYSIYSQFTQRYSILKLYHNLQNYNWVFCRLLNPFLSLLLRDFVSLDALFIPSDVNDLLPMNVISCKMFPQLFLFLTLTFPAFSCPRLTSITFKLSWYFFSNVKRLMCKHLCSVVQNPPFNKWCHTNRICYRLMIYAVFHSIQQCISFFFCELQVSYKRAGISLIMRTGKVSAV